MGIVPLLKRNKALSLIQLGQTSLDSRFTFTRASSGSVVNASGTLVTAATDEPRFDHNPSTLQPNGLLNEGARTNSIRNSQAGGGAVNTNPTNWRLRGTVDGITAEVAGVGTQNGFNYVDVSFTGTSVSGNGFGCWFETATGIAGSNGQTWAQSLFIALQAGSIPAAMNLSLRTDYLDSGGAGLGNGDNGNIRSSLTSTLARFTGNFTVNQAATANLRPMLNVSWPAATAINFTVRIAAPQLEQGNYASSFIATSSAAATRALDSTRMLDINTLGFNPVQGTIFCEFSVYALSSTTIPIFTISDGTTNNRLQTFITTLGAVASRIVTAGVTANPGDVVGLISPNTVCRVALAYGVGTAQGITCVNGTLSTASSPASLPALATYTDGMRIGSQPGGFGATDPNIHIRRLSYRPVRLPNAALQQLTAL